MSKLVDPHICPDCRAPLDPAATCTRCGLRLVGPPAVALWERMQQADRLIEQLRAAPAGTTAPTPPPMAPPVAPQPPQSGTRSRTGALPGISIPVVLLALGGLCLLVAAIVFVAVAWSSLGLAAKTTIMLVVTGLFASGAVVVTRRDLRFAAETLWLLVAGMVAVDLGAAYGADMFGLGRLSDRDAVGLVGAALLGLSIGVGAWATATPLRRLHGLVGVAALGTLLFVGAEAWLNEDHQALAVAVSVPLLLALAWAVDRSIDGHLRSTAVVLVAASLVSWLELISLGLDRMATTRSDQDWWSDLAGWPLLVAAGLAAGVTVVRRVPDWARTLAAGGAIVALVLFAVGPSSGPTSDLLTWAVATALLAGMSAAAPLTWARPAGVMTALGLLVWTGLTLVRPLQVISLLPTTAPTGTQQLGLHLPRVLDGPASWTAIVGAVVVGVAAAGLVRHLPSAGAREVAGRAVIALGPGAVALGATSALLETRPTLLVAVIAWSATVALAGAMAVTTRKHDTALIASLAFVTYLVAVDLRLAVPSHLLAGLVASVAALVLATAYARTRPELLSGTVLPVLAAPTVVLAGFAATQWPYLAGGRGNAAGLCLAGVAAAALVVARWAGRDAPSRITIEVTALLIGLGAVAFPDDATVVAMVLTVLGSAVAVASVLGRDRDEAAWIGIALLGVATVIRVVEDVRAPEVYTLPAAALLLAAGWWRLGTDREVDTAHVLSSGLALALVPSLLLALDEPVSLRGALVAAGGLVALAVGVARHWAAPFVAGALTSAVLAVRHLGPVIEGLPRWISLGSVGLVLLVVGVTWEQRRRDVEVTSRYLAALR
jgi:hypothetical protein